MRVSRSGAWTSLISPHSKRVRSRSSRDESWRGDLSELMTICLFALCSVLNVWKNSSWVRSARSMNWMSSMRSRSTERYRLWKACILSSRTELMKSLVNSSQDTYRVRRPGMSRCA